MAFSLLSSAIHFLCSWKDISTLCKDDSDPQLYLDEPVSSKGKVVRRAVLGDVLLHLALAPSVDQLQHLVPDELEGVAVGPAGTVVVPAGLGGAVNARRVYRVTLGTDVFHVIDVSLLLGAVQSSGAGEQAIEGCQQQR